MVVERTALPRPRALLVDNSLHRTGAFVSALEFANALKGAYDVEIVLPSTSTLHGDVVAAGLICHSLPMSELGRSWAKLLKYVPVLASNTLRLRRLLARRHATLLIVNDYYNLLGAFVRLLGWRGLIVTMVRLMPHSQQRLLNYVWTRLAISCSDKVIAVSRAVFRQLPASDTVEALYNPSRFVERYPEEVCKPNDGTIRCLYLANYIAGKGHRRALEAFARAYGRQPRLRLRFVGSDMGLDKNRALKSELERVTASIGLEAVVCFEGFCDDVEQVIKQSDIVLNFSESESFSQTCLEASAFGRPVIATKCGGPEEIVDDGVSGLLVPVDDIDAMAEAIVLLAESAPIRRAMGASGRIAVRRKFGVAHFLRSFERILNATD